MTMGTIIRSCLIAMGAVSLLMTLYALAHRRMHEVLSGVWVIISLLELLTGILVSMPMLNRYIGWRLVGLAVTGVVLVQWGFYQVSLLLSDLIYKVQELSMQVSLLNEENLSLRRRMEESV